MTFFVAGFWIFLVSLNLGTCMYYAGKAILLTIVLVVNCVICKVGIIYLLYLSVLCIVRENLINMDP